MVELDQIKFSAIAYEKPLKEMEASLGIESKLERIQEIERHMEEPTFWDDASKSAQMVQELKNLKDAVETIKKLKNAREDILTLIEMADEENDESLIPEVTEEFDKFEQAYENLRMETLLSDEFDHSNAIVSLHAGAGGTESCDWANMLFRMYQRWVNKKGYSLEILDILDGDEAGIKSVTFQVNGASAYGYLKSEHGVHRLVRISPFNAAGKRQTSFVSCDVMPVLSKDVDVEINMDDLRIDTYRSSGAGGQHINKTSSAIRITHLPTGIVVQCQNERSQFQNKDKAMEMLKAKLYMLKKQEQADYAAGIRGDVKDINFGSQIRSYVLQPYTMVKDHRTGVEIGNAGAVLDGKLDPFINGYLSWLANGCKDAGAADDDL
jgi:peptide chain release factor 2